MATSIKPVRVNHMNVVYEDHDASVAHLKATYDAEFLRDLPSPQWHANLIHIGRVIFESFIPPAWLLHSRHGPLFIGLEYQADMDDVRAAIAERGIRIVRDIGVAVHTHAEDTFGMALEFYGGYFHDNDWAELGDKPMRPQSYWADEHPLGVKSLKCFTLATYDLEGAVAFLKDFLSGTPAYEAARPAINARAVGVNVADSVIEVETPTGEGELSRYLGRQGQGIRALVFGVKDVAKARAFLEGRGVKVVPGSSEGSIAVPAEANLGVRFEFAQ